MRKSTSTLLITVFLCLILVNCSEDNNSEIDKIDVTNQPTDDFIKLNHTPDSIFRINSILQLPDSTYSLSGGVSIKGSYDKILIMKLNKYGDREWMNIISNSTTPMGIESHFIDNNSFIGYRSSAFGSGEPPSLIKFNEFGDVLSELPIENSILGYSVIKEQDHFIVAGSLNNMKLQKIDFNGEVSWTKSYNLPGALSISKLFDENYISIGGGGYSSSGRYLVKSNKLGEKIWDKPYKGKKVLALPDNGFVAITTIGVNNDVFNLIRFDENGNEIWSKEIKDASLFNTEKTVDIINYNLDYVVYSYLTDNSSLSLKVLNNSGELINSIVINDVYILTYAKILKTLDDGLFISRTGENFNIDQNMDFIKLSKKKVLGL